MINNFSPYFCLCSWLITFIVLIMYMRICSCSETRARPHKQIVETTLSCNSCIFRFPFFSLQVMQIYWQSRLKQSFLQTNMVKILFIFMYVLLFLGMYLFMRLLYFIILCDCFDFTKEKRKKIYHSSFFTMKLNCKLYLFIPCRHIYYINHVDFYSFYLFYFYFLLFSSRLCFIY